LFERCDFPLPLFNPKLNTKNSENLEEEKKEIIYYYPNDVPILDQIKNIGLAKAIIKFTNTFQLKDTNSNIHSHKFRQVLIQPEKDFWISMKISIDKFQQLKNSQNGQENSEYINKQLNDTFLESKLTMLYLKFRIFNDSFSNIMNDISVEALREKVKLYFDVCIPFIKFDTIDILSTITGLNMISLSRDIELEIEDFIDKVHKNFPYTSGALIFWKNNVIYNDMDFNYLKDMTVLYDYLIDPTIAQMPLLKINTLQNNEPIIKPSHMSTSSVQSQLNSSQSKNTTSLLQSIKNFYTFSNRETYQNTGFLTGPLSLNNSIYYNTNHSTNNNSHISSVNSNSITSHLNKFEGSRSSSFFANGNKENSSRPLFSKISSRNSSSSDIKKFGIGSKGGTGTGTETGTDINNTNSTNNTNNNNNINNINNNNDDDKDDLFIKENPFLNQAFVSEPQMDPEDNDNNSDDTMALPQIIYLGENCEPYYLIIYKYLEEITALFFIKISNNQEFEDTYVSLSKLSKSKDTITSFDSINSKEDIGGNIVEVKLKSEEFYYSFEAIIRSDLDQLLNHMEPYLESQNNIIDDQYKYIIFKHSKMLIKASKGYLKSPNFNKTIAQFILDLYEDIEKKQDCSEICIRSNSSLWIAIKRVNQCDYILVLPRNGFKELTEIDDEFNKIISNFQQQHESGIN